MFRALIWMCALAAFLGVICALVTEPLFMRLVMLALSVILFTITGVLVWLRPGKGETPFGAKEREPKESPEAQRAGILEEEIQKTARQAAILRQELDELYNKNAAPGRSVSDREAISLALERIRELSDQICTETGDGFDENASEILSSLTGGRYVGLALDERHQIRVFNGEELLMPDQVGSGTASLVYFAMRLAAGELMSGENLPLIMDDPFGSFDDERLEAVLSYLEKSRRQVILFTPGRREALLLEKIRAAAEAG